MPDTKPAQIDSPAAVRALRKDRFFAPVVKQVGAISIERRAGSVFSSLSRAIIYQQLAGRAAQTIHGRFVGVLGGSVTERSVLDADPEALRGAGLSRAKLGAILDLAAKSSEGTVRLRGLSRLPDEEVVNQLTVVRGIGEWTAQMFLMFHLGRPDVWPVGDLGVRAGWARIHGLDGHPDPRELRTSADHLAPWRSAAAWYCWRAVDTVTV